MYSLLPLLLLLPIASALSPRPAGNNNVVTKLSPLLAKDMIALPRPGSGVPNPEGKLTLNVVAEYDLEEKLNQQTLYLTNLSHPHSCCSPQKLLSWNASSPSSFSNPFWFSSTQIGYLNSTGGVKAIWGMEIDGEKGEKGKGGYGGKDWDFEELEAEVIVDGVMDVLEGMMDVAGEVLEEVITSFKHKHHKHSKEHKHKHEDHQDEESASKSFNPKHILTFPSHVSPSSIKYTPIPTSSSGILSFSASVWQPFTSFSEDAQLEKQHKDKPSSGVVYDDLFLREWDTWRVPGKVNQLFVTEVSFSEEGSFGKDRGSMDYFAPFNNSGVWSASPAPIGSDAYDVVFSESTGKVNLAVIVKDLHLSPAFHTKQDLYFTSFSVSKSGSGIIDFVPAPNKGESSVKTITKGDQGAISGVKFSPSGTHIAWLEQREDRYEADRNRVITYDLSSSHRAEWTEEWDRSPTEVTWSHDGKSLFLVAESHAVHLPYHLSHPGRLPTPLLFNGTVGSMTVLDEKRILITKNTLVSPNEDFVIELPETKGGTDPDKSTDIKLTQITHWSTKAISKHYLSPGQSFWFKGSNNHDVNGWIFFPPSFKSSGSYPLAFLVHGGPEGSWADSWSTRWNPQVWASQGYVVVAINPTGSTGYGEEFTRGIRGDWGGRPYKDLMAGLDYVLEKYPSIDSERMTALGGSYGGYMMFWIAGHNNGPRRFQSIVSHDGVFDSPSMWFTTEQVYFDETEHGNLPPWENPGGYQKYNPANFIGNWDTPMLVIQGELDYRVPLGQSIGAFTALQRKNIPSRFLYFPDENHWVLNQENSLKWHHEVFRWMGEWVDQPVLE